MTRSATILSAVVSRLKASAALDGFHITTQPPIAEGADVPPPPASPTGRRAASVRWVGSLPALDNAHTIRTIQARRTLLVAVAGEVMGYSDGDADPISTAAVAYEDLTSAVVGAVFGTDQTLGLSSQLPLRLMRADPITIEGGRLPMGGAPVAPRTIVACYFNVEWVALPSDPTTL